MTNLFGSCSLRGGVRGKRGSAGLIPWLFNGVAVTSFNMASSLAIKAGYPEWEHDEVTEKSLLASVKGGETGIVWKMEERGSPWEDGW